jgi:hypothetical protein
MTTPTNHDDILDTLKAILAVIRWLGLPLIGCLAVGLGIMVTDHYSQATLERDRDEMKPRVTRLWLERHPEVTAHELVK